MPRPNPRTTILALAGALLAILLVGAGLAFLGHLLFDAAWAGLGLDPVVFPNSP